MKVISLAATKGGVGKTLMTASLAVLAQQECDAEGPKAGRGKVALIDFDPQGSLTEWFNARSLKGPMLARCMPSLLGMHLTKLRWGGVRYLFIDTPPGHSEYIAQAMNVADIVVIPIKPGELDLEATKRTIMAAKRAQVEHVLLPNDANFRSRAMGQTIALLREAGLPLLPAVHHRVGLMLQGGRTLTETDPDSRGALELARVWAGIRARLGNC